ncbi:EscU/YscU/HrcU family type III secretion system export apparatus switch protein [uncultured Tyzzerella sp.]|uniref:EscU/YscU/HrcU family type III secretion system export apparatus switch protein n=1 Tax=uncultured Tyzzerella sp. TaxID=2321398 RepID=UPI002942794F|nr:EscU/YscU/HrcU family type III secretion system export apparatus switch protein [uncultured Tyzzerella sp.]
MKNEKNIKNKKAVALKYNSQMTAPKVIAKGQGYLAEKILETAKDSDITVYENKELVEELEKIDLGLNIPPHLYEVVAQVLLFVSNLDKKEEYKKNAKQQANR